MYLVGGTMMGGVVLGAIIVTLHEALSSLRIPIPGISFAIGSIGVVAILSKGVAQLLPQRSCQVPQRFLTPWPLRKVALHWGFSLGLGFCTYLVTPALFVLVAAALSTRQLANVLVACGAYGFARGSAIAVAALVKDRRQRAGVPFSEPPLRELLRLPLVATAVAALVLAIGVG